MKTCKRCEVKKPEDEFYRSKWIKDKSRREGDGWRNICKACSLELRQERRKGWSKEKLARHKKKQQAYVRAWEKRNPVSVKARFANSHAKRAGARGRLTIAQVLDCWEEWGGKCWVCGFDADQLDHFRPINCGAGGTNTRDNIRPICKDCNWKRTHEWHGEDFAEQEAALLKQMKVLLNDARNKLERKES